jgi:hypothetical protein
VLTATTLCGDADATNVCSLTISTQIAATLKSSLVIIQDGAATTDSTRPSAASTTTTNTFEE